MAVKQYRYNSGSCSACRYSCGGRDIHGAQQKTGQVNLLVRRFLRLLPDVRQMLRRFKETGRIRQTKLINTKKEYKLTYPYNYSLFRRGTNGPRRVFTFPRPPEKGAGGEIV